MTAKPALRLRKMSPVDREFSLYEVVDEAGEILFDVGKSDDGVYELAIFDHAGRGRVLDLVTVMSLIKEAQRKIEADE